MIPYGRQTIDESDLAAVAETLKSDWLTQGPKVREFEEALAKYCGAKYAVAYSNGTTALQGAYAAAGLKAGDEFVTTPLTFAATSNAGLWQGARPVFADVEAATGNLDPKKAAAAVTKKTRAVIPVDYSGRPVDLDAFRKLADEKNLILIEDACHALGASYKGRKIGSIADLTVFSFHPVKSITTGEGGAVLCDDEKYHEKLLRFRTHGITRGEDWEYSVDELGQNCRLTDLQSALGTSQLKRLDAFVKRRRELAARYDKAFKGWDSVETYPIDPGSSWHLYPLRLSKALAPRRREIFRALRKGGIGVQVHYIPVDHHPLYQSLGYKRGACPISDDFYAREISIPMYPTLTDAQQDQVVKTLKDVLGKVPA